MTRLASNCLELLTEPAMRPESPGLKMAIVVMLLCVTSAVRWAWAPYLHDELKFFPYLPAIVFTTAYCGFRCGFATVAGALFLAAYFWIPPANSWGGIDLAAGLSLAVWFLVSSLLVVVIALLQKSVAANGVLVSELKCKTQELEEKSARLESSEKRLAAHAGNLEQLVAERTAKLAETIAELESFSYTASHDLRSPLRAMQGFAHLLLSEYAEKLDDQGRDYLRRIDRAAQRMDELIRDVLNYSAVGRAPVKVAPVDLETVVDHAISHDPTLQLAAPAIEIRRPLLSVVGHEAFLSQALSNLVRNAIKFVATNKPPRIEIWSEPIDARVRLHVADNGIGISPAALPHIFKPFHRAHEAARYDGTGIGLAIVKRAIERQGGSVGVQSHAGKGSDFWVELPRAQTPGQPRHEK